MENNKITDLYCVDCDNVRKQKYKGALADGSHLYICKECGCENTISDDEIDK